jgi:hypothetical protein
MTSRRSATATFVISSPRHIASARIAQKTPLLTILHSCVRACVPCLAMGPVLFHSISCCLVACLVVATRKRKVCHDNARLFESDFTDCLTHVSHVSLTPGYKALPVYPTHCCIHAGRSRSLRQPGFRLSFKARSLKIVL